MKFNDHTEMKVCQACQQTFHELFDAYSNTCPSCLNGHKTVLVQADGIWIWQDEREGNPYKMNKQKRAHAR